MPVYNISIISTYCYECNEDVQITLPIAPQMLQGKKADIEVIVTHCAKTKYDDAEIFHECIVKVKYAEEER